VKKSFRDFDKVKVRKKKDREEELSRREKRRRLDIGKRNF